MRIAYFDLIAGISGDMILASIIDAGLPFERLRAELSCLKLTDFELGVQKIDKLGFLATKVSVHVKDDVVTRHIPDIEQIIRSSDLPSQIQDKAIAIFRRLGHIEANIHGTPFEEVHLHELGGVDTIVDVVGTLVGLDALGVEKIFASPVPLGRGFIRGAHGQIPVPAPATLALLAGVPLVGSEINSELVTPTGAVLLTALAESFGPIPSMRLESIGYGAGTKDLPIPNLLRLLLGESQDSGSATFSELIMVETNIDDLNPEIYQFIIDSLFKSGALDVFLSPIQMKKNRPAILLQVLVKPGEAQAIREILFRETSTLGVRQYTVERYALQRETVEVDTPYGSVRLKIAHLGDGKTKAAPEFEDCRRLAERHQIAIRDVYDAALRAYWHAK